MRKLLFLAVVVMSLGCAITDYPVITDTRGADANAVMTSFYDKALIIPSAGVATIWSDGSDDLFTLVTQTWEGDQWLYTYDNFDPTATIMWIDQLYCDPTHATDCWIAKAWNPDLPNAYPHGDQGAGYNNVDNIFDYFKDDSCMGARSLSVFVSYGARYMGECGSGLWGDKQAAMYEFSTLEKTDFRGKTYYSLPIDSSVATFNLTGADGATSVMPIYGRFNGYLDNQMRLIMPVTSNAKYQLRWMQNWVQTHGTYINMDVTYGSLNANFKINMNVGTALDRL